jgi:hypothetical protein
MRADEAAAESTAFTTDGNDSTWQTASTGGGMVVIVWSRPHNKTTGAGVPVSNFNLAIQELA